MGNRRKIEIQILTIFFKKTDKLPFGQVTMMQREALDAHGFDISKIS
jgi:hypothetical protein